MTLQSAPMTSSIRPETDTPPLLFRLYRLLASVGEPLAQRLLLKRLARGKEDRERLGERRGEASAARPRGFLLHVHAASVGETNSVLPLLDTVHDAYPDLQVLLTTGTVTSARLVQGKLPAQTFHQFAPLDIPSYVDRFAAHWRPDLSLFVESELWPNMLMALKRQGTATGLINARMSQRSSARWRLTGAASRWLLNSFDLILAQDETDAVRLRMLGAAHAVNAGNLKYDVPAPVADEAKLADLRASLAGRPLFLAASTHSGEEVTIADAHRRATETVPDLLTIIVPRHAERGSEIAEKLRARGFAVAQRSRGEALDEADLYVADTMGELGLFFRIVPVTFMGGSLVPHGGQNPIEPIKLDSAVLHGPHVHNFSAMYARLDEYEGARLVRGSHELAEAIAVMMGDRSRASEMANRGQLALLDEAGALTRTLEALRPFLDRQAA